MAQVSGVGTVWNLPNYFGELFTADLINTPFINMIGGLLGLAETQNFEFAVSSEYDFAAATQPAITETASLTAPTATEAVRTQEKNVTQIFQQAVNISYAKLSNGARLSGINTAGLANNVQDEKDFQILYNLAIIARNFEYSVLNGTYQIATAANVANKTRGMLATASLTGGTNIAAAGAALTKAMLDNLFKTMFNNGANMVMPVLWANANKKQTISSLYETKPLSRTVGGNAIDTIVTDFGEIMVAQPHRFMPDTDVLLADMNFIKVVTQPTPGKGNLFYEDLAKTGAAEVGQIFGQLGLDHGPAFMHGKISGLLAG